MARRRKWRTCFLLLVMFLLDLVIGTWSLEEMFSSYGSRSSYSELEHMSRRQRERRGRQSQRTLHLNQRRDRRNQAVDWNRDREKPHRGLQKVHPPFKTSESYANILEPCCPTTMELVEPLGGINRTGEHVALYRDKDVVQRFYEVSCHPSYVNRPCKFFAKSKLSTCTQQYSYTYALIDRGRGYRRTGWTLDYIKIRSGCACEVPPLKMRKRQK